MLAPNPSGWTFEGTNTWLIGKGSDAAVIDPGPSDDGHMDALTAYVRERSWNVAKVLLTHSHGDHAEGATQLSRRLGASIDPLVPKLGFTEGTVEGLGGLALRAFPSPGHTLDSVCFIHDEKKVIFAGDTALARVNPFISPPDGSLRAMMSSIQGLIDIVDNSWTILPGHGPVIPGAEQHLRESLQRRHRRIEQVAELWDRGMDRDAITDHLYVGLVDQRKQAATATVSAIIDYLK